MDRKKEGCGRPEDLWGMIPGGIRKCLVNEGYSVLEVNQGFYDMFGYGREEIEQQFHGKFMEMIHPEDRDTVLRETDALLSGRGKIVLHYRVLCSDGIYKWVADNTSLIYEEGEEVLFSVMLDVAGPAAEKEELKKCLERLKVIMRQTENVVFEWDISNDTITFSENWAKKFGYESVKKGISDPGLLDACIHPEDTLKCGSFMEGLRGGAQYSAADFRILNAQGRYLWCRVRAAAECDESGRTVKAAGIIEDIDMEKRQLNDWKKRAEQDALTGLFNREETERKIRQYLDGRPVELCALFMIDTDNFKLVNDRQGHLFGDAVLSELAAGMRKMTGQTDVVGRIGGDEFTIFLKDIESKEMVEKKAESLLDIFRNLFRDEKKPIEVTCSVGAAMYPEHGEDFHTLYRSADLALYQAKSKGKNQFVLFDPETAVSVDMTGYSTLGAAIDSNVKTEESSGDLVNYVFHILYDTSDFDHAIQTILEIIGKRFDVSRAYIFENSDDNQYADNTFEWCNEGIVPQKEFLQHYPYEAVKGYKDLFRDHSIFYCRDIHSLTPDVEAIFENQGVCSTLQCAIQENEVFRGFVGFDECTGIRMWTKDEIGMLSLISQLLSAFLQKKRAADTDRQMAVQLNTILDVQDAYIYAIDKNTFELYYLNQKTRELDPNAAAGMTCYRSFFGRDLPCAACPLSGGSGEVYNPKYKLWTKVRVVPIKWGSRDAYLISCFDITEYKQMQDNVK